MSKTFNDGILPIGFWADEALSSYKYYVAAAASTLDYVKRAGGASNPYPMGIIQDDNAASIGQEVAVKMFGYTKAVVDSRDIVGNACPVVSGTLLTCGSESKLMVAGASGQCCARSWGAISTGSAIINVFFFGGVTGSTAAAS